MASSTCALNESAPPPVSLEGLHVVITGGASGLGLYAAEMFLSNGSNLSILDINAESGPRVVKSLEPKYPNSQVSFFQTDAGSYESQAAAFKASYNKYGKIDIVFANAGIALEPDFAAKPADPEADPVKPSSAVLDININGVVYTTHLGIHYIRKGGKGGSIICTASIAGLYPFPHAAMYGTSKHAVVGLVRSLAPVLKEEHITVNGLAPNYIQTAIAGAGSQADAMWKTMKLTPPSTLQNALKELTTQRGITGAIAELSGDVFTYIDPPAYVNEMTKFNMEVSVSDRSAGAR